MKWCKLTSYKNKFQFYWRDSGTARANFYCTWNPSANTWYHIAIVRNGSNEYIFVDGVSQGLTVDVNPATLGDVNDVLKIGQTQDSPINGWIDEFRISDTARWTSNFTPPSEAYNGEATGMMTTNTGYWGAI